MIGYLLRNPAGFVGLSVVVLMTPLVLVGPLMVPFNPLAGDENSLLVSPSWPHILGTDNLGRDQLSRLLHGGRVSLALALAAVALASAVGFALGLVSGYLGGAADLIVQRVVDALISFPPIILAIGLVAVMGSSLLSVVVAIAAAFVANVARVTRASTLVTRHFAYVESARAVGVSTPQLLARHIAPNVLTPVLVVATANVGRAVLLESAMSFLGLGVALPDPSWGNMLSGDTRQYFFRAPHLVAVPGIALSLSVLGFNLLGDAIADFNNPRLRVRGSEQRS